jgi:hypothetical protein
VVLTPTIPAFLTPDILVVIITLHVEKSRPTRLITRDHCRAGPDLAARAAAAILPVTSRAEPGCGPRDLRDLAMKSYPGPPMTLGNAVAARVRLIVWCKDCRHRVEPDAPEMAQRYGAETPVGSAR